MISAWRRCLWRASVCSLQVLFVCLLYFFSLRFSGRRPVWMTKSTARTSCTRCVRCKVYKKQAKLLCSSNKARSHGGYSGEVPPKMLFVPPNFLFPQNFVVPRKIRFNRTMKTKILPPKFYFVPHQPLKPGYGPASTSFPFRILLRGLLRDDAGGAAANATPAVAEIAAGAGAAAEQPLGQEVPCATAKRQCRRRRAWREEAVSIVVLMSCCAWRKFLMHTCKRLGDRQWTFPKIALINFTASVGYYLIFLNLCPETGGALPLGVVKGLQGVCEYASDMLLKSRMMTNKLLFNLFLCLILKLGEARAWMQHLEGRCTMYLYLKIGLKPEVFGCHTNAIALLIALESSSNPQKIWQVFWSALEKNFLVGGCGFFEWRHKCSSFWAILAHVTRPRAQPLDQSISLKFSLETRLDSESFEPLVDFLAFVVQKFDLK